MNKHFVQKLKDFHEARRCEISALEAKLENENIYEYRQVIQKQLEKVKATRVPNEWRYLTHKRMKGK